jgi:glycosyltransferase involved in cell wall biosynthesis
MHVLGITDYLGNVGGAEISASTILTTLAERDDVDRVTVVGIAAPEADRLDFGAAEVVPVSPPPAADSLPDFAVDLLAERRLARAAEDRVATADVVHSHHRRSTLALSYLDIDVPTVATVRDFWPACPISIYHVGGEACTGCNDQLDGCMEYQGWDGLSEPVTKAYLLAKRRHQRPALEAADCAVFIAAHLQERLSDDIAMPDRTETIYNPVELNVDLRPASFDEPTFVTASSLTDSKGVEIAVRAVGRLHENYSDARLLVFGDGPLWDDLEELAADVAPEAVEFHGRVPLDEVYAAMKGATATIFPSMWDEPFGRVTVESMILGTPVVGSDVGGIAEIIDDERTGLLFPPGDEVALAAALRRLCADDQLAGRLAAAAQERSTTFDPERVARDHRKLYGSLLELD